MHLTGRMDASGASTPQSGLARLARVIERAKAGAPGVSLLVDNGDLIQGTPLALTSAEFERSGQHPLAEFLNAVGYDVIGLGNHDFDFGLAYLEHLAKQYDFPVLSANATGVTGVLPRCVIERTILADDGQAYPVRIGVTSALPQQTAEWSAFTLRGAVAFEDPLTALEREVAALRAEGADLVVIAAHGGLEAVPDLHMTENFALGACDLEGVDAVISGHLHQCHPDPGVTVTYEGETPRVMPGHGAAHLGCIDLDLSWDGERWTVDGSKAQLLGVDGAEVLPDLIRILEPLDVVTSKRASRPITSTDVHLHSFFAMLQSSAGIGLVADAMLRGMDRLHMPDDWRDLPQLAAIAPILTGGLAGPDQFFDFPPGPLPFAATEALFPYEDVLTAKKMTGADLRIWLDRAAAIFWPLGKQSNGTCPLLHPQMPGFCFDMISGLTVRIDPTRPARFGPGGALLDPNASRIAVLDWQGQPVQDDDTFVVCMSSYRVSGGGGYPLVGTSPANDPGGPQIRTLVREALSTRDRIAPKPIDWSLVPDLGVTAVMETSPRAAHILHEIADFRPEVESVTSAGFLRLRLHL